MWQDLRAVWTPRELGTPKLWVLRETVMGRNGIYPSLRRRRTFSNWVLECSCNSNSRRVFGLSFFHSSQETFAYILARNIFLPTTWNVFKSAMESAHYSFLRKLQRKKKTLTLPFTFHKTLAKVLTFLSLDFHDCTVGGDNNTCFKVENRMNWCLWRHLPSSQYLLNTLPDCYYDFSCYYNALGSMENSSIIAWCLVCMHWNRHFVMWVHIGHMYMYLVLSIN